MIPIAPLDSIVITPSIPLGSGDQQATRTSEKVQQSSGEGLESQQQAEGIAAEPPVEGTPTAVSPAQPAPHAACEIASSVPSLRPSQERVCGCWDGLFSLLFVANVITMAIIAIQVGMDAVFGSSESTAVYLTPREAREIIHLGGALAVCGFALAMVIAKLLTVWPRAVAILALWLSAFGVTAATVASFMLDQVTFGVVGSLVAIFCFINAHTITRRIPFVVVNLRVAAAALAKHQGVYVVAFVSTVIQILWLAACVVAFLGVASQLKVTREADHVRREAAEWSHFKPGHAVCRVSAECASRQCIAGMDVSVGVCRNATATSSPQIKVNSTLLPLGSLCNSTKQCAEGVCTTLWPEIPKRCKTFQVPATTAQGKGTTASGLGCSHNFDCVSGLCGIKRIHTDSFCLSPMPSPLPGPTARDYTILTLMGSSSYWSLLVFKNVVQTTTAGVVAAFWYGTDAQGATQRALGRSLTSSLGAISLGSFLLATVVAVLQLIKQFGSSFFSKCAEKVFSELEPWVQYFNRWSFVYVSMYGHTFTQASLEVMQLFTKRGLGSVIDADLEGRILHFAAIAVATACFLLSMPMAALVGIETTSDIEFIQDIVGLVAGLGIALTPLAVIDSALATICVCFAEDPAAFELSNPQLYQVLVREWHRLYPDAMVLGGYVQTLTDPSSPSADANSELPPAVQDPLAEEVKTDEIQVAVEP